MDLASGKGIPNSLWLSLGEEPVRRVELPSVTIPIRSYRHPCDHCGHCYERISRRLAGRISLRISRYYSSRVRYRNHPFHADIHYMNQSRSRISPRPPLFRLTMITILLAALLPAGLSAEEGLASWYGGHFQGRKTANGEIFDTNLLTAAHKSLPFGTIVQVMHKGNGKTVQVRINDRGPFVAGRIIDLSRAAADALGLTAQGVAPIRLTIVQPGSGPAGLPSRPGLVTIQVASYSSQANAAATLERLKAAGLQATLETAATGITRVILPEVARDNSAEVRKQLASLGFTSTLVREN